MRAGNYNLMLFSAATVISDVPTTPTILGESWGFWCQLLVLLATAAIAIHTLRKNERRARKRATIDLVLSENQDGNFREIKEKYSVLRESGENLTLLICSPVTDLSEKQIILEKQEIIIAILNQYEFIASAIFEDSLDEDLYKRMKKGVLIRDWNDLNAFVSELRRIHSRNKIFCEIERLVKKWEDEK